MIPYGKLTVKGYENMLEWFWYTLAATLAGVGTGLVGLSAATAMVPVLIVLCPSFTGETGAYQATAIALASDILGSAVTTATYIRHRNIDLKRSWIMLACITGPLQRRLHLGHLHPRHWGDIEGGRPKDG